MLLPPLLLSSLLHEDARRRNLRRGRRNEVPLQHLQQLPLPLLPLLPLLLLMLQLFLLVLLQHPLQRRLRLLPPFQS